jgi:hypothetical protein
MYSNGISLQAWGKNEKSEQYKLQYKNSNAQIFDRDCHSRIGAVTCGAVEFTYSSTTSWFHRTKKAHYNVEKCIAIYEL